MTPVPRQEPLYPAADVGGRYLRSQLFFFSSRRRHTRFDCDWSSDVCSSDLNVVPYRLDNGLKILTLEDHSVPAMSYYTVFQVGSRNERPGRTGISHLFEHMMFKIGRASCRERV